MRGPNDSPISPQDEAEILAMIQHSEESPETFQQYVADVDRANAEAARRGQREL